MSGQAPPARHSHTLNYVPKLGIVVIYGGRNDALGAKPILGDLWLITLANMEYHQVLIGGFSMPNPRYCHSSFVYGSELAICGGLCEGFKYLKDIEMIELDQAIVNKENPRLNILDRELAAGGANAQKAALANAHAKRITLMKTLNISEYS